METFIPRDTDSTEDFRPTSSKIKSEQLLTELIKTSILRQIYRQQDSCMDMIEVLILTSCVMLFCSGLIATVFTSYKGYFLLLIFQLSSNSTTTLIPTSILFISGMLQLISSVILFFCVNYSAKKYAMKFVMVVLLMCIFSTICLALLLTWVSTVPIETEHEIAARLNTTSPMESSLNNSSEVTWDTLQKKSENKTSCKSFKEGCSKKLIDFIKESINFFMGLAWVNLVNNVVLIPFLIYLTVVCKYPVVIKVGTSRGHSNKIISVVSSLTRVLTEAGAEPAKKETFYTRYLGYIKQRFQGMLSYIWGNN